MQFKEIGLLNLGIIRLLNAPRFTAFAISDDRLYWHYDKEKRQMFIAEVDGVPCGYYSLLDQGNGECELNNLAVLPEYRHRGLGTQLLKHSFVTARKMCCQYLKKTQFFANGMNKTGLIIQERRSMTFFHLHADTCGEKYEHIIIVMNHSEWGLRKSDGYEIQYC